MRYGLLFCLTWLLVPGRMQIPIAIRMTSTLSRPALSIFVTCDSLLVDGAMVFWEMPEAQSVWRVDVPPDCAFVSNSSYQYVVIPRAGTGPVTTAEAQAAFTEAMDVDGPR